MSVLWNLHESVMILAMRNACLLSGFRCETLRSQKLSFHFNFKQPFLTGGLVCINYTADGPEQICNNITATYTYT